MYLALGSLDLTLALAACLQIDLLRLRGTRDTCQTDQEKEGKRRNQLYTCVCLCVFAEEHLVSNQRSWGNRQYPHHTIASLGPRQQKFICTAPAAELFYFNRRIQLETVTWFLRLQWDAWRSRRWQEGLRGSADPLNLRWRSGRVPYKKVRVRHPPFLTQLSTGKK